MNLADKGKRVGTYVIDLVATFILVLIVCLIFPEFYKENYNLTFFVTYFFYCFLFELFTSKTLGKIFTKTIVVDVSGGKPSFGKMLIRNSARLVPFDSLTYLYGTGYGLHDLISKTKVVSLSPQTEIIGDKQAEPIKLRSSKQNKRYTLWIIVSCLVNITLFYLVNFREFSTEFIIYSINYLLTILLLGFITGLIVSIFPYKDLPYSAKYLRSSLLVILVLNILWISIEIFQGVSIAL